MASLRRAIYEYGPWVVGAWPFSFAPWPRVLAERCRRLGARWDHHVEQTAWTEDESGASCRSLHRDEADRRPAGRPACRAGGGSRARRAVGRCNALPGTSVARPGMRPDGCGPRLGARSPGCRRGLRPGAFFPRAKRGFGRPAKLTTCLAFEG